MCTTHDTYWQYGDEGALAFPSGVAADSNGCIFVASQINFLHLLTPQGKFYKQIGCNGSEATACHFEFNNSCHIGLTVDAKDRLLVADVNNFHIPRIQIIDNSQANSFKTRARAYGIGYHPGGAIVTCESNFLRIYSEGGKLLKEFRSSPDAHYLDVCISNKGDIFASNSESKAIEVWNVYADKPLRSIDGDFGDYFYLSTDRFGRIFSVDEEKNRMQAFLPDTGKQIACFGSFGTSAKGKFHQPRAVTVTNQDYVVVADRSNHRVQGFHMSEVMR